MHYILGIDEAGRGPWAGPVVAAGVLIPSHQIHHLKDRFLGLTDSKKLSQKDRERIFAQLQKLDPKYSFKSHTALQPSVVIDDIGIRAANRLCMQEVISTLMAEIERDDTVQIMIDGCDNFVFDNVEIEYIFAKKKQSPTPFMLKAGTNTVEYIIHGDSLSETISLASIVAKVSRDHVMCEYSVEFPGYGFGRHKGYGTLYHQQKLRKLGVSPIHRRSYAPVRSLIFGDSSI